MAITCSPTNDPGGELNVSSGCVSQFISGGCSVKLPEEGHSLGPWVQIEFEGSGSTIQVGNDSSPNTNPPGVAVIKSFEFGYSDGLTVRATIHDQQGGSFEQFMQNILKDYACLKNGSPAAVRMKFAFGWCKSGCNTAIPDARSNCFYALCDSVETNYSEGKIIFELTGKDICARMFEGNASRQYGGSGKDAIHITDAIQQFMTSGPSPNVGSVRFLKMEGGSPVPAKFKENGTKGIKGSWVANGRNKLETCREWLRDSPTIDNTGWIPQYNSYNPNGELIFWADSKPNCRVEGDGYWSQNCIGTYIVNGAHGSPVIEFNPKIRWDFGRMVTMGGSLGNERLNAQQTQGSVNPGINCPTIDRASDEGAGHIVFTPVSNTIADNFADNATKEARERINQSIRTLKILTDNIEADLTVVGDPTLLPPNEAMWSKNVAIVVVNPYFISFSGDSCGEWMSQPTCHPVLTNRAWLCKSITHRIEAGNYTTTIGVYLVAPGIDIPKGSPLGASSSGWAPPVSC